jgi:hypothetical protein
MGVHELLIWVSTNCPRIVAIGWGGALVGHWGIIIYMDNKRRVGDFAEDIQTIVDP